MSAASKQEGGGGGGGGGGGEVEAETCTMICNHSFHSKCLTKLLLTPGNLQCPLCRGEIMPKEPSVLCDQAFFDYKVIDSMAEKGLVSWDNLPPTVRSRMSKVLRNVMSIASTRFPFMLLRTLVALVGASDLRHMAISNVGDSSSEIYVRA
jgi:hypothetical protein